MVLGGAELSCQFTDIDGRARHPVGGVSLPGQARFDDVDERVEFGDHGVSLRSTMFPSRTRPPPDNLCPIRSVTRRAESQERARAPEPDSVAWSQARRLVDPEPGLERAPGGE